MKFQEDAVISYKEDKQIPSKYHSRPLYVTISVHDAMTYRAYFV